MLSATFSLFRASTFVFALIGTLSFPISPLSFCLFCFSIRFSHVRFLGFSLWLSELGFGFSVALISSHCTRIGQVLPIFFVDHVDFAFSDLLLMPVCFGEINLLGFTDPFDKCERSLL